jgi:hypothetical protein
MNDSPEKATFARLMMGKIERGKYMQAHRQRIPLEQAAVYEVQIQGLISQGWLDYFADLQTSVDGEDGWAITTLTGCMRDQAELHGLLQKLYSLGMVLLKVERLNIDSKGEMK